MRFKENSSFFSKGVGFKKGLFREFSSVSKVFQGGFKVASKVFKGRLKLLKYPKEHNQATHID